MVNDTAFLRYPHYYRGSDTPDQLRFPEMAPFLEGIQNDIECGFRPEQ